MVEAAVAAAVVIDTTTVITVVVEAVAGQAGTGRVAATIVMDTPAETRKEVDTTLIIRGEMRTANTAVGTIIEKTGATGETGTTRTKASKETSTGTKTGAVGTETGTGTGIGTETETGTGTGTGTETETETETETGTGETEIVAGTLGLIARKITNTAARAMLTTPTHTNIQTMVAVLARCHTAKASVIKGTEAQGIKRQTH